MNHELVIFDCDGVLVQSEPLVNRLFVEMIGEFGHSLDVEASLREFSGVSLANRVAVVGARFSWTPPEGFIAMLLERLSTVVATALRATDGIRAAIEALTTPYCVASNGLPEEIKARLTAAGLIDLFPTRRFSASEVARPKPAPDVYLHAARTLGVAPARCVVVEDSLPGVRAAVLAGMRVLAYASATEPSALRALGAVVFDDMRALPALLRESF